MLLLLKFQKISIHREEISDIKLCHQSLVCCNRTYQPIHFKQIFFLVVSARHLDWVILLNKICRELRNILQFGKAED